MRLEWEPRALKDFDDVPSRVQTRISAALARLAQTRQSDVVRLTDVKPPEYRLRVGEWRVRFARDDATRPLTVLRVLPRGEACR